MNVLMINGSPKPNGNTYIALHEMEQIFLQEGIQVEMLHIGNRDIRGCIGCGRCMETGKCVFDDLVNETAPKLQACDGLVVGTPGVLRLGQRHPGGLSHPALLQHPLRQDHEGWGPRWPPPAGAGSPPPTTS